MLPCHSLTYEAGYDYDSCKYWCRLFTLVSLTWKAEWFTKYIPPDGGVESITDEVKLTTSSI